jgi:dTDP-4-amino-4,6-dideoxygalactose transaminase
MIQLFNIPEHKIDTSKFSNLLHDKIVREFEENFAEYVGGKYAVSLNSATTAIFLLFMGVKAIASVPSIIPPVVINALINAGLEIKFNDKTDWVGDAYMMGHNVVDSAQRVNRNQCADFLVATIFSFYPTKPIGSCDGGMIVSNDSELIEKIRMLSFNGTSQESNNWERKQTMIGYKAYMNSIQAYIANENLKRLDEKKEKLSEVRMVYNSEFGLTHTSDHLYRVKVTNNKDFIKKAKDAGIVCGIHYEAAHRNQIFGRTDQHLPLSDEAAKTMVSIPFHEKLTKKEIQTVIRFVNENR